MLSCLLCFRRHRNPGGYCSDACRDRAKVPRGFDGGRVISRSYTAGVPRLSREERRRCRCHYCGTATELEAGAYCSVDCNRLHLTALALGRAE